MTFAADTPELVQARIEAAFGTIARERMAGVPILNPALDVAAIGTRAWNGHWLAILVTPWCMNVLLLPQSSDPAAWKGPGPGDTLRQALPGGSFAFIVGEEPALGRFLMCSLFSPMQEFADQAAAVATAEAVMVEIMTPPPAPAPAPMSRRRLFGLAGDGAEAGS